MKTATLDPREKTQSREEHDDKKEQERRQQKEVEEKNQQQDEDKKSSEESKTIDALKILLGSSYVLLVKTHGFHWNVTGEMFQPLHALFEEQYNDLFEAVDTIAEQIRALQEFAPGTIKQFTEKSLIKDAKDIPDAKDMIKELLQDHETLSGAYRKAISIAQEEGDEVTADLFIARCTVHEKTAWMLRSFVA